ncbi:FK506-binding protein 2 [Seminavis robusta]|uniref:peptidylprolyl isomerase n=1 Tax=Seminavis robusta TaxID=568900 RepID=A0A9N8HVN9_9STRA|nr:FK506-binding protein 2 [Seminavis robusta]|eukprot:Sro2015_g311110.1 FK506-binding protein 2 (315) ;mRNA; f:16587-17531
MSTFNRLLSLSAYGYLLVGFCNSLSLPSYGTQSSASQSDLSLDHSRSALCRRQVLTTALGVWSCWPSIASSFTPDPQAITNVILDSPEMKLGVYLYDVAIGSETFPAAKSVQSGSIAALANVQPGMIVLGNNYKEASKSVVERIRKGPYPIVLQFYDLANAEGDGQTNITPLQALQSAQEKASQEVAKEPPLSAKGTGLVVLRIQNPASCENGGARRGDTLEINFEARVASPGGPIYDSTQERGKSVSFTVGSGEVINGVDIGVNGMCPGEIRTMDIPSGLGYGRFGSDVFDVPGDVRLWWRVELLTLTKKNKR